MNISVRFAFHLLQSSTQRKHFFRWLESFKKNYFLTKKEPWIVFDAVDYLNSLSLENKRVFEYGSGSSTLYWLSRNMPLVSVEHDSRWFELVRTYLGKSTIIDYRLVQPEKSNLTLFDIANPLLYLSDEPQFKGYNFRSYVSQIDEFPNGYFDVILVDGRARPACIRHSVPKINVGGLLIVDNSDRSYYFDQTKTLLKEFQVIIFHGATAAITFMSSTTVFKKMG
jgi:hypothetical protein